MLNNPAVTVERLKTGLDSLVASGEMTLDVNGIRETYTPAFENHKKEGKPLIMLQSRWREGILR